MQPRKYSVLTVIPAYGGNSGSPSVSVDVMSWFVKATMALRSDCRVDRVMDVVMSDTPITMVRNDAIVTAQRAGADILIMVDSDMAPDLYQGQPDAKPFIESSLDFLDQHYERGPVCIGAPYCGPEPNKAGDGESPVYVFEWTNSHNGPQTDCGLQLQMIPRNHAARMAGIAPVAAIGTGLVMWDMRLFKHLPQPYFEYEWEGDGEPCHECGCPTPGPRHKKASTEDVMHTRNISLIGEDRLGYNPVFCNWDAWAGHWKPKCVGKPRIQSVEQVNRHLRQAYETREHFRDRKVYLRPNRRLEEYLKTAETLSVNGDSAQCG